MNKTFQKLAALFAAVIAMCCAVPAAAVPGVDWITEKLLGAAWEYITRTPLDEIKEEAANGDAQAQYILGLMYYDGDEVTKNYQEALKWIRRAAEEQEHAYAQYFLGVMYDNGIGTPQNQSEAARWYYEAAEQGIAEAQYNLGVAYHNGEGVKQDTSEAVEWYRMAAEQGDADALDALEELGETY